RPADRAALDPAHDGPRRRRVPGRGDPPIRDRPGDRPDADRGCVGGAASGARLPRRGGPLLALSGGLRQASGGPSGAGTNDCGTVAATLRYGRSAEAESRHGGYTPVAFISNRTPRPDRRDALRGVVRETAPQPAGPPPTPGCRGPERA